MGNTQLRVLTINQLVQGHPNYSACNSHNQKFIEDVLHVFLLRMVPTLKFAIQKHGYFSRNKQRPPILCALAPSLKFFVKGLRLAAS